MARPQAGATNAAHGRGSAHAGGDEATWSEAAGAGVGAPNLVADFVEAEMRDLSSEAFGRFMDEVYARLFTMVNSTLLHERLGGVRAIDQLVDVSLLGENANKCSRFANYLRDAPFQPGQGAAQHR